MKASTKRVKSARSDVGRKPRRDAEPPKPARLNQDARILPQPNLDRNLRIILVEDDASDAELILDELRQGGIIFSFERVHTRDEFVRALEGFKPDLILSDNSLPGFGGLTALRILQERTLDIPFIFVSGTIGEEMAIDSLKKGATDYVIKDRLSRLVPAVQRALRETDERSERRRAEAEVRVAEAKFRGLVEQSLVGIYITQDEKIVYVNPRMAEIFGYAETEMMGMPFFNLVAEQDLGIVAGHLGGWQKDQIPALHYAFRGSRKDGITVHVEVHGSRTEYNRSPAIIGTLLDVSERKRAQEALLASEEQLRQSQKMEAVGRLAGGIAHDFSNLLTAINGYAELLLDRIDAHSPYRWELEEIKKAGERATSLTRQLLAFSRKQVLEPRIVDLNEVVANVEKMLRRVIGEDIELITVLPPTPGRVKADPGQIEQVIMNLAVNARDALPYGGKLIIETANVELDETSVRRHPPVEAGHYVMLAVSDTGCGIDPATQSHIFEPFFTTKERGKGTGLGLSTVYGIIQQSNGYIWVYSEVGKGTTFKIFLPRSGEDSRDTHYRKVPSEVPRGWETILLVEDDNGVRWFVREVLEASGYRVLESSSASDALVIGRRHDRPIHLVITDVVMPQISGRDLIEKLTSMRPGVKALYVSGYTEEAILHHGVLDPGVVFLQKPFTPDALARRVRRLLDT